MHAAVTKLGVCSAQVVLLAKHKQKKACMEITIRSRYRGMHETTVLMRVLVIVRTFLSRKIRFISTCIPCTNT